MFCFGFSYLSLGFSLSCSDIGFHTVVKSVERISTPRPLHLPRHWPKMSFPKFHMTFSEIFLFKKLLALPYWNSHNSYSGVHSLPFYFSLFSWKCLKLSYLPICLFLLEYVLLFLGREVIAFIRITEEFKTQKRSRATILHSQRLWHSQ